MHVGGYEYRSSERKSRVPGVVAKGDEGNSSSPYPINDDNNPCLPRHAGMPAVTKNNSMAHTMSAVPCSSSESSDQPFSYRIGGVDLIDSPLLELGTKASSPTPLTEFRLDNQMDPTTASLPSGTHNQQVLMSRGTRQPYFVRLPSSPASISMHPPALQTYFSNPGTLSRFYRCDFEGCGKGSQSTNLRILPINAPLNPILPKRPDFKSPWHLQSHNKHHSHERNYNCVVPSCGAKFQRRPDLLRHCKSVHAKTEDRTIACVCGKSFGRLDSLRRHQNKICPSVTQSM